MSKVPDWFAEQSGFVKETAAGGLYNLREDLGQRNNRYAAEPDRVADLTRRLDAVVGDRRRPSAGGRASPAPAAR